MAVLYEALQILCGSFGIEPHYVDNQGKVHHTTPEAALQILGEKGIRIDKSLIVLDPQVLVLSHGNLPSHVSVYLPVWRRDSDSIPKSGKLTLRESAGRVEERNFCLDSRDVVVSRDEKSGLLLVSVPFPQNTDVGHYRFHLETTLGQKTYHSELLCVICPDRCYQPSSLELGHRIGGISIALYGVRSATNWGVGDFHDLKRIVEWAKDELRVDFVGLNPLHALFNRRPFNNSPYLPSSRLYRNFIYLDITAIEDFAASCKAQALVSSPENQTRIQRLRDEQHVNYEEVSDLKLSLLRELFKTFLEASVKSLQGRQRWNEFEQYRTSQGLYLERYATFCALAEHFGKELPAAATWRQWPVEFQDPGHSQVEKFQSEHNEEILFWMYVQWQIDVQLHSVQEYAIAKGMLVGLYLDQALSVDRNGADFWGWRDYFHEGFSIGAPPDAFAPKGQDWGFAPPDRERMRSSGFDLFLRTLEANCRNCGALRIDHVMQLNHLFWIPQGEKPHAGVFVQDYEADLLHMLCLESQKAATLVVGEDLGTLPFNFRERLMDKGILSYRLFYFERDAYENQVPSTDYPPCALVSISTHDLPTLAGFWSGRDIEQRTAIGLIQPDQALILQEERNRHKAKITERLVRESFLCDQHAHAAWESTLPTDELHTAVLSFILHTPCKLALVSQEDLFLDVRQQNIPGTTYEHPNWVTKMRFSIEEFITHPDAIHFAQKLRRLLEESGRIT